MSVCQRSAQGAKAPQRPPAKQAEPLTAHPKIVETVNFGWPSFLSPFHGFEPVGGCSYSFVNWEMLSVRPNRGMLTPSH